MNFIETPVLPMVAQLHPRSEMFLEGNEWGQSLALGSGSRSLPWGPPIKAELMTAVNSEDNQGRAKSKA